jgi:hypothetical protein
MQVFNDRFILLAPELADLSINETTDAELEDLSPDVAQMAKMVRQYSVLLTKAKTRDIYSIITEQVDPRIALILASARDNNGIRIFANLERVKEVMFGPPTDTSTTYLNAETNIFSQGVKRVAAGLCAAILIGQLAQLKEQAEHSQLIEEKCISDLERLIRIPDIQSTKSIDKQQAESAQSFYFEPKEITLTNGQSILLEIYIPSLSEAGWKTVSLYSGSFNTSSIISDIADYINHSSLVDRTSNIIAAPVLASDNKLHRIDFQARARDNSITYEVISVRITPSSATLPFIWGVSLNTLRNENLNAVLITVQNGKTSATALGSTLVDYEPTVIYFRSTPRNANGDIIDNLGNITTKVEWAQTSNFSYRVSPTMEVNKTVTFPYVSDSTPTIQTLLDNGRPGKLAELLLNELFLIKGETKCLGALIRNDKPDQSGALIAVELVAFTLLRNETWLILDLLNIPRDIEVAVGNIDKPLTPFSNKPRSVRVETKLATSSTNRFTDNTKSVGTLPSTIKIPVSDSMRSAMERGRNNRYPYG